MKKIMFGFYGGLGDVVSDLSIIKNFQQNNFMVRIYVHPWLVDVVKHLSPKSEVISYKKSMDLLYIDYSSFDFVFLTPNYIHTLSKNKKSLWLYLIKEFIVFLKKNGSTKVIAPSLFTLIQYSFNLSPTYLNNHFSLMTLELAKINFKTFFKDNEFSNTQSIPSINRIIIFPFSGSNIKDYPLSSYIQISNELSKNIDSSKIKYYMMEKDNIKMKDYKNVNIENHSLTEIYETLNSNDLIICNDSGPGHISAYKGANVIALFGITNSEKYSPKNIGKGKTITLQSFTKKVSDIKWKNIVDTILKNYEIINESKK